MLVPAIAAGALILYLATRKSTSRDVDTGIRTGTGPINHVKGKSGTEWDVQMVEAPTKPLNDGGAAVMQVILNDPKIPARKHMVIEYLQVGSPTSKPPQVRTLAAKGPSTLGLIQAAISDFGVTGAAAQAAANGL
jgi:hypothetical protein